MTVQAVFSRVGLQCLRSRLAAALVILTLALPTVGFTQAAKTVAPASAALPNASTTKSVASKPFWSELAPMQQQALKPLAVSWNTISEAQKRKWLEISKNYPTLSPADQTTLHSRMNEWVALSPQQRAEARLNFATTKELSTQLTPEEKRAKWQTYQALSPEEKQQLASKATPRPAGAALAVKPVAPQKLVTVAPQGSKPEAKSDIKSDIKPAPKPPANPASTPPQASQSAPAGIGAVPLN